MKSVSIPTLDLREDRKQFAEKIVKSPSPKRLIVAGPGTGKTTVFKYALEACGGRGLALTFINNLVKDLEIRLSEVADVFTFHGYCKSLLHRIRVSGLTNRFEYYPPLYHLLAIDFSILGRPELLPKEIERCFHKLDNSGKTISQVLELGNFYDGVSHTDLVYRVLEHFRREDSTIPQHPLVVVDEFQDFSRLEVEFIKLLATKSRVLIAGDDDQALYGFKHAEADFIRELAKSNEFDRFKLPYCSRCTEVIVNAVGDVVKFATARGRLRDRISDKPFCWFPPDKEQDSRNYPQIVHANCTVETAKTPLMGRYIALQIQKMVSQDDVRKSRQDVEPTVLVIGPPQFVKLVHRELQKHFDEVEMKEAEPMAVDSVHGYAMLAENNESRHGWRIILHCHLPQTAEKLVKTHVAEQRDFVGMLSTDFRDKHLGVAKLIAKLLQKQQLDEPEQKRIEAATRHSLDEIKRLLRIVEDKPEEPDVESPRIVCTTLSGSKGLAARYVFMVGMNNGHFPKNPAALTDDEICQFIVGLTRTRKKCYVISCGRFGMQQLNPSVFLQWIRSRIIVEQVSAASIKSLSAQPARQP